MNKLLPLSDYIERYGLRPYYSNKELINKELINKELINEKESKRLKSINENLKLLADKKIEMIINSAKIKSKKLEQSTKNNGKKKIKDRELDELLQIYNLVDEHFYLVNCRRIVDNIDSDYSTDGDDDYYLD